MNRHEIQQTMFPNLFFCLSHFSLNRNEFFGPNVPAILPDASFDGKFMFIYSATCPVFPILHADNWYKKHLWSDSVK